VHGFLVFFSLEDRESFHHIRNWFSEIERFTTPGSEKAIVLVGSKMDMTEQRKVSHEEARKLADEFGVPYFETSAKTGEGVDRAYFTLASMSLRKLLLNSDPTRTRPPPPSMAQPDTSKGWFASLFDRLFSSSGAGGGSK
jgi:Ras-related protein Rab-8A